MIKIINESSRYDYLMKSYKKGDLDDETALRGFLRYKGDTFNVFIQFDSSTDKYPRLIGYFGDGSYDDYTSAPLKANDIKNCELNAYMDGYDIVDFEGMLRDNPKMFYIRESGYSTSRKGQRVQESRYSDVVPYENRKYWYFTTHGIGPGTIPPGVHLLDVVEGQNKKGTWGDFICLDAILNTSELRQYDLIELAPDNVYESVRDKNNFKIGDKVKSKSFNRNVTDMAFNGTIIDIDEDGLCTVECSDGDVVDGILPNRLVKVTDECFISENLSTNDTEHMWFVCDKDMRYVRAISEEECNDLVYCTIYEMLVDEGIIDEDDETYCNNSKLYQDFKDNIIEAKYAITKTPKGLPTFKGSLIMKDRDYVGPLPFGYYVDENDDLISPNNRVVAHNIRSLY